MKFGRVKLPGSLANTAPATAEATPLEGPGAQAARQVSLWRSFRTRAPKITLFQSGLGWTGLDAAVPANRLDRLLADPRTQALLTYLQQLSLAEVEWLAACARVNARQAAGGFQRTAVLNLTAPFAVVFGLGQIFPDSARALVA